MSKFINISGNLIDLTTPIVMGIMNITSDSFYSGSRVTVEKEALKRAEQILLEGGSIIDIGGQSTSPTSKMLSSKEEWSNVSPILEVVRKAFPNAVISIDTFYADVAKRAVEQFGVNIVNDISGGEIDVEMFETVARLQVPYILMHMRGTPQTMQQQTDYNNLIQDIFYYFSKKISELNQLGIRDIIIDPGFGFSKTLHQNYQLMSYLKYFDTLDVPILVGISRKSMIYKFLKTTPEESLNGTTVLNTFSLLSGAHILRVHDVKEATDAIRLIDKINNPDKE